MRSDAKPTCMREERMMTRRADVAGQLQEGMMMKPGGMNFGLGLAMAAFKYIA
jgi:hypothetical protein